MYINTIQPDTEEAGWAWTFEETIMEQGMLYKQKAWIWGLTSNLRDDNILLLKYYSDLFFLKISNDQYVVIFLSLFGPAMFGIARF